MVQMLIFAVNPATTFNTSYWEFSITHFDFSIAHPDFGGSSSLHPTQPDYVEK